MVKERGLFYPPDPASKCSCTLGGNVSENAGGPKALKYGVTKDYVLNLEVVLPTGEIIWTGANVLKNSTGYNLTDLMVGSAGPLGIITKILFKLIPLPKYDITLLVPLELRIMPSYIVMSKLNLVNTFAGLILPISASAIATFFFRQFYKSIPDELLEAAKLDGTNSLRFFLDFLIPLSKTMIAAVFIFMFVFGYNQYLWPLIMTTSEQYWTVVMGLKTMYGSISDRFAFVIMSMIPPVIIIIFLQKLFIQGIFQNK